MKRIIILCSILCLCVRVFAQATDLVVDCQTPGWLSSKINYADQLTVRNLKVTGYINSTDLKFIGTLLSKHSLKGVLDLSDSHIVGTGKVADDFLNGPDILSMDIYGISTVSLKKFIVPKSMTQSYRVGSGFKEIDTLVYDCMSHTIEKDMLESLVHINHLKLGENVDSICETALSVLGGYASVFLTSVYLPQNLKYIGKEAFDCTLRDFKNTNIKTMPSLEYLGDFAFGNPRFSNANIYSNSESLPDSIWLPKIKIFYITAFDYRRNMHVFIGNEIEYIYYSPDVRYTASWAPNLENVYFHIKSPLPPKFINVHYSKYPNGITYCVPKGSADLYRQALGQGYKYNIIEEDVLLENISLNPSELQLEIGETSVITPILYPENASDRNIVWSVDDESIVKVSQQGEVTAVSPGKANVFASSSDGRIQSTCRVWVVAHAESVSIEPNVIELSQSGATWQLTAVVLPENAIDKTVVWKSSNEQICTVSPSGLVTAIGAGTAVITATTIDGGYSASCVIKVIQHVTNVQLNKTSLTLNANESERLFAMVVPTNAENQTIIWSSTDVSIATIDASGNVIAKKAGEIWVKAVSQDNSEARDSCKVTVVQPVTGITLSQSNCRLTTIGEGVLLEATVLPADATNKEVRWTSSNEAVCVVANGKVVATGYGTAVVMCTTDDGGFMATCTIVVEKETVPVASVVLSQTTATMTKGETLQLTATALPNDATDKTLIWKSSDEGICVVTQTGLLIAMQEGKAIITVAPNHGAGQAQCEVTVSNAADGILSVGYDGNMTDAPIYDILGRRAKHLVKGSLYIQNGKKFIAQ